MSEGRSRLATASFWLGVVAAALIFGGPLLVQLGVLEPVTGFRLFLFGGLPLGLATFVLALIAVVRGTPAGAPRLRSRIALGIGVVSLVLVGLGLPGARVPQINDITTSPDDPPAFRPGGARAAEGGDLAYPPEFAAQQREGYPDLAPIRLDLPPAEAYARAQEAVEALGWEVTLAEPSQGHLEAKQVSPLFRFVDDLAIRVRPAEGGSVVDVRSKSRVGKSDLGANAARIRALEDALR